MFEYLKKYIVKDDNADRSVRPLFWSIDISEIEAAESELGLIFPDQLRRFFIEIGYGFFDGSRSFVNRMMDPASIADFHLERNYYEYSEERDEGLIKEGDIAFFELDSSTHLTVRPETGAVYYCSDKIAESIEEFVSEMKDKADYFL